MGNRAVYITNISNNHKQTLLSTENVLLHNNSYKTYNQVTIYLLDFAGVSRWALAGRAVLGQTMRQPPESNVAASDYRHHRDLPTKNIIHVYYKMVISYFTIKSIIKRK